MASSAQAEYVSGLLPSATDLFQGATINSGSPMYDGASYLGAEGMFDATATSDGNYPNIEEGHTIFEDGNSSEYAAFSTSSPITLNEINLFDQSDNGQNGVNRSLASFSLYVLTSANTGSSPIGGGAGSTLIVSDSTSGTLSNDAPGYQAYPTSNGANQYTFAPVTGQYFEIDFTNGLPPGSNPDWSGPRIMELDAFNVVPEPASAALIGVAAAGLLARRRRSSVE